MIYGRESRVFSDWFLNAQLRIEEGKRKKEECARVYVCVCACAYSERDALFSFLPLFSPFLFFFFLEIYKRWKWEAVVYVEADWMSPEKKEVRRILF